MMDRYWYVSLHSIANDPKGATKCIAEVIFSEIYPLLMKIRNKLQKYDGVLSEDDLSKIQDVYKLCSSQIKKCLQILFDIFKTEYNQHIFLQDSRQCTLERLLWCINRLFSIEHKLDNTVKGSVLVECSNDSILVSPMYFVNWIDHTFEVLSKLAYVIYKTDYKETDALYNQWRNDIVDCVTTLHISLDELLLSAMTLCKYSLPTDQHIIKARCQVVLRESKNLMSELIQGDLDAVFKATPDSLKLPIMPSNVNVLIDVLKDVLYVLETNTNTALLALLVHSFSYSVSPVDVLKEHFANCNGSCLCNLKNEDEMTEDCLFVKEFDLYNERLLQIGSFAVSCSSDQNRISSLRSGLASLEALDPHLVPALLMSPDSHHALLLMNSWRQEVQEIKENVFLIVDPAAFAEKSKQLMHQLLLEIMKETCYNNKDACSVINIGSVVYDFFSIYNKHEPDALTHHEKLIPLLADLNKVQMECKIVSNLLCTNNDFVYDVKKSTNNEETTLEQLLKRLKLLYTIVNRINSLLHPKENDDQLFDEELEDEIPLVNKNITHTILNANNGKTYVHSPRKPAANISRSIFARSINARSSRAQPLSKLTKHLKARKGDELSFSLQLEQLFNLSDFNDGKNPTENNIVYKQLDSLHEPSILYNFSPRKRSSLRKAVLNKHCVLPFDKQECQYIASSSLVSEKGSLMDEATSLQITDILNEMDDKTSIFSTRNPFHYISKNNAGTKIKDSEDRKTKNILKLDINSANMTIKKDIWSIPVNASTVELPLDDSVATTSSNVTLPSNVATMERINDIDLVESKLKSLKSLELETSL